MDKVVLKYSDIRDSCEKLESLAESINNTNSKLTEIISSITSPSWSGDAAKSYAEKLENLNSKLPDASRELAMSILFLASVADGYESIEDSMLGNLKELIGGQDYIDSINANSLDEIDVSSRLTIADVFEGVSIEKKEQVESLESSNQVSNSYSYSGGNYSNNSQGNNYDSSISSHIETLEKYNEYGVAKLTNDSYLYDLWKKQGENYKDGLAYVEINGELRYLVSSDLYGSEGTMIDVNLENGDTLNCIVVDSNKDVDSKLEFKTDKETIKENGKDIESNKWDVDWNTNKKIESVEKVGKIEFV